MEFLKRKNNYFTRAEITISTGETVLNFCSNNYLGLSSHPEVVQAAKDTLDTHGFGVICPFYLWDTRYSQDSREKNFRFLCKLKIFYMQQLLMQTEVLSLYLAKGCYHFR
jgi:hypothetical protein